MARTILDEMLHARPEYIEHQLAHAVRDPDGRACNRTAHLDERREMCSCGVIIWTDSRQGRRSFRLRKKAV